MTLQGNSFNAYPNTTKVTIGSSPCTVVSISNFELTCTTPSETDLADTSLGPRGLLLEVWSSTEADVLDTSTLDISAAGSAEAAVAGADVICTLTPSTEPILRSEWVKDSAASN